MSPPPMSLIRRRFSSRASSTCQGEETDATKNLKTEQGNPESEIIPIDEDLKQILNNSRLKAALCSKLQSCMIIFSFEAVDIEIVQRREKKRKILLELVDFLNSQSQNKSGSTILNVEIFNLFVEMISVNVFHEYYIGKSDFDPEEDEPILDPSWPHKQVVYELLLRLIICPSLTTKLAKKNNIFDKSFLISLIGLFESGDTRERDYLKSILHRIYGKFFTYRRFIREQISYVFCFAVNLNKHHPGLAELLEILGSIINGFCLPLKSEHIDFLNENLLPLHKVKYLIQFSQQLSYCVTQFVEKDKNTLGHIILYLSRVWPVASSQKQILFLTEIEELLEIVHPINDLILTNLKPALDFFWQVLGKVIICDHFQVAERALFLWNNQTLATKGILSHVHAEYVLPYLLPSLLRNVSREHRHWCENIVNLSERVLGVYEQNLGKENFEEIVSSITKKMIQEKKDMELLWSQFETKT